MQSRGYTYWKALTTGKSPKFGGIPHDMYGMTTRGVRTYQIGIKHKLGLWVPEARGHAMSKFLADVEEEEEVDIVGLPQDIGERSQEQLLSSRSEAGVSRKLRSSDLRFRKRVTKIQTGGPDGDLGSNEIKLSVASEVRIRFPVFYSPLFSVIDLFSAFFCHLANLMHITLDCRHTSL